MEKMMKPKTNKEILEQLAKDAFTKQEYVNALMMASTPMDYKEREKAFVKLALARKEAAEADIKLELAIKG